jgi:hypothetical protein
MIACTRNRLIVLGVLWELVLVVLPAVLAFNDRFVLSPFLVTALACAALSGAVGVFVAGRWVTGSVKRGLLAVSGIGALQGLVSGTLAFSLWIALSVTISGFSVGSPGEILDLLRQPAIFVEGAVAAIAVFVYTVAVGIVLFPVIGAVICRLVRGDASALRAIPGLR